MLFKILQKKKKPHWTKILSDCVRDWIFCVYSLTFGAGFIFASFSFWQRHWVCLCLSSLLGQKRTYTHVLLPSQSGTMRVVLFHQLLKRSDYVFTIVEKTKQTKKQQENKLQNESLMWNSLPQA